jgi:citrate synthase
MNLCSTLPWNWSASPWKTTISSSAKNVDFYSGIILKAMGFPTSMFTVLFAMARTVGWIAQWKEMIEDPQQKIGRPRQLYTGHTKRPYVLMDKRD